MIFDCDEQIGGYRKISVFLVAETDNWPVVLNDESSNQITAEVEQNSICGVIVPDSIRVRERVSTKKAGQIWNVDIQYEYNLQDAALEQLLDQYANKPMVCEVEKNFGQKRLYGSNNFPLIMTYSLLHGRNPEDGTRTLINIRGKVPHRSVYIDT